MKNRFGKRNRLEAALIVTILIIPMATTAFASSPQMLPFNSPTKSVAYFGDEIELKYYDEENLDQLIGISGDEPPYTWKSAIRLTHDEMEPYADWTMTKVNVAFCADNGQSEIDVQIFIYDKGTSTLPGPIIVEDTTACLNTTGITAIPLVTPVDLAGHDELWVAVQWTQTAPGPGVYYAWLDTLSGPHVPNKSDFIFYNNAWNQLHILVPSADGRWGLGAIIEGSLPEPPNTPVVSGPTNGEVGSHYSFTLNSTDPEDDDIYYLVDWGDGTSEDWMGPYDSGETVTVSHSWSERGTYVLQAKAKDDHGMESTWSDPFYITIRGPILMLGNITGGIGQISVDIDNIGDATAMNVIWTIQITGGLLHRTIVDMSETISEMAPATSIKAKVRPIGFGWITITVTVHAQYTQGIQKTDEGILLFFITSFPP
ncbi:MAG: PKD domain-containing protein [Candidatus Thermoplasmatota archaeon]|nr:PKD domain-containing protein [Candidatus Thermoplasmatota archaeon]